MRRSPDRTARHLSERRAKRACRLVTHEARSLRRRCARIVVRRADETELTEFIMHLIVIYLVLVAIGEVMAFAIGRVFESSLPGLSMLFFMALFFGVLWVAWPISVAVAERFMPEHDAASRRGLR